MESRKSVILRQGDVLLTPVAKLPAGIKEVPLDNGRIVLAYGEVTGHAHAIADHSAHVQQATPGSAEEITEAVIARVKARLWQTPTGERFLEVKEPVNLTHEEHTAHTIQPGIYQVPVQVEYSPAELRRVED